MKVKISTIVKASIGLLVVAFVVIDLIYNRGLTTSSSDFSLTAQRWGGSSLAVIGNILSTVFTYWILVYLHAYVVLARDHQYMVYTFTSYFFPLIIVIFLKAIYYRGRPYVISEKVDGCECDPGMPSGHACMAVMCYSIAYDQARKIGRAHV